MHWILIFLIGLGSGKKQELRNSGDLDRYFTALEYLESRGFNLASSWSNSSKAKKKNKSTKLNVIETIEFQGIEKFESVIEKKIKEVCVFDSTLCITPEMYRDRFNFSPFQLEELKNLGSDQNSELNIIFSKPIGNHLTAILTYHKSFITMGRISHLLFMFDEEGSVNDFHVQVIHYQ